jgi:hypothetical protein
MPNAKRKVAVAVSAAVAPEVTPITFVSIVEGQRAPRKTKIARAVTVQEQSDYDLGFDIGTQDAENEQGIIDALATCNGKRRIMLRQGYVAGYISAPRYIRGHYVWPTEKQAENRFDNTLAKKHAPAESSRQAKSNAKRKKGGGRKAKTKTGEAKQVTPEVLGKRFAKLTMMFERDMERDWSEKDESDFVARIGEYMAILNPQ